MNDSVNKLCVLMPVYNEVTAIEQVLQEWTSKLREVCPDFALFVINDGSDDGTKEILEQLSAKIPELKTVHRKNSGHGPSCLFGYQQALEAGNPWVLQLDSDGQCDPQYFQNFWQSRKKHPIQYGYRKNREDGLARLLISRVLSLIIWLRTKIWVKDANVPYRLIKTSHLSVALEQIPKDEPLANIPLAVFQQKNYGIHWQPISFRKRYAGNSKMTVQWFIRSAIGLMKTLKHTAE